MLNRQLVEVVRQIAATYDLEPLLASIEQAANGLLPCEKAQIMQYDPGSEEFYDQSREQIRISARVGASARAAATQKTIRVGTSSEQETLVVPLIAPEGDLMGVLHVLGPHQHRFSEAESELALVLGALAAIALKRQALVDQAAANERLDRELSLARELVSPPAIPELEGYELAGSFQPAQQVGGDCYDVKRLGSQLAFLVADASGHGLDSALVVSRCRAYFRALVEDATDLGSVAARLNRLLQEEHMQDGRFVAASLGRLDLPSGRLELVSAGQPLCLWAPVGRPAEVLEPSAPPLGLFPELAFEPRVLSLERGDLALFYTDGLADWRDPAGECFGDERLARALERWRHEPAADLCARLYSAARQWGRGTVQPDDVTCLLLRASGRSGP